MKKSKNIISDWLGKYGDPEIDKKVEEELERMTNKEESKQDFTEEYEKQLNISDVSGSNYVEFEYIPLLIVLGVVLFVCILYYYH